MGFLLNRGIILLMNDGILFIDKPVGMNRRQVDNAIVKLFHTRKVGHLGTLDPFATGLLVIGVNKGNKFLPYLGDETKTYLARLKLGEATSTGDHTGEVVEQADIPALTMQDIKACLDSFLGQGQQIPPMTSAIKVDGTALYELAHQGKEIERKPRDIEVFSIRIVNVDDNILDFIATVSKGTYMRTLGEDIAEKLGTVGHLKALRRVAIGPIGIEKSTPLEEITESSFVDPLPYFSLPCLKIQDDDLNKVKNGMKMALDCSSSEVILVHQGSPIAVYEKEGNLYRCKRGLW